MNGTMKAAQSTNCRAAKLKAGVAMTRTAKGGGQKRPRIEMSFSSTAQREAQKFGIGQFANFNPGASRLF